MATDKLEIKIVKDSKQRDAELDSMSLEVTRAFLVLAESLMQIAEKTNDNDDLKIEIKKGSVSVAVHGNTVSQINKQFYEIINNESINKELIEPWRKIQNLFIQNGILYDASFFTDGKKIPFYETLKTAKKLRAKPIYSPVKEISIVFMTGKLIAVGGKIPNIHIENNDGNRITISCDEKKANKAKAFLYDTIYLSAWITEKGEKKDYEFCDSYFHTQLALYSRLQTFIAKLHSSPNEIEALKLLHYECRSYLDSKNYGYFKKFLRIFNHHSSDINMLNTILIATQSFKNNEDLNSILVDIENTFQNKVPNFKKIKQVISGK